MIDVLAQAAQDASSGNGGTAEQVLFWVLAPVALGSALLMVLSRNAVHAALWLVLDFFCLAVFYAALDAPFLAAVQVIVYTGAIMVLFLFVLMLVGVDREESLVETIRGHRLAALLVSFGFAGVLIGGFGRTVLDQPDVGLAEANANGNVYGIAQLLFTDYVLAFELTSALLIVAAVGAMVLAHKETERRPSQREQSIARFRGTHPTPLPGPGVYAGTPDTDEPPVLAPPAPGGPADFGRTTSEEGAP
ncbi:MAG TPA: NADH-quinone oxidoreductase subunit J [Mycobacteriales bacterium]|nr:NADH-quinone oxidoreductase subunit J [Mycobacteriales bacterium]